MSNRHRQTRRYLMSNRRRYVLKIDELASIRCQRIDYFSCRFSKKIRDLIDIDMISTRAIPNRFQIDKYFRTGLTLVSSLPKEAHVTQREAQIPLWTPFRVPPVPRLASARYAQRCETKSRKFTKTPHGILFQITVVVKLPDICRDDMMTSKMLRLFCRKFTIIVKLRLKRWEISSRNLTNCFHR